VIGEDLLLKLKLLDILRELNEISLHEASWYLGVPLEKTEAIVNSLMRSYVMSVSNGRLKWSAADNPSALKPWGWKLVHEIVLGSTMEYARSCGAWTAVVAEYQVMGRGRAGKKWVGNLGGIWVTLRFPLHHENAGLTTAAIPLIVANVLEKACDVKAAIKWPNDLIYGGKKLAGVLVEGEAYRGRVVLDVGVGINVNNEPPLPGSTSLKHVLKRKVPRNTILSLLIGQVARIDKLLDEPEELTKRFREKLITLNRRVRVVTTEGVVEGEAVDITDLGELVVRAGGVEKIISVKDALEVRHLD